MSSREGLGTFVKTKKRDVRGRGKVRQRESNVECRGKLCPFHWIPRSGSGENRENCTNIYFLEDKKSEKKFKVFSLFCSCSSKLNLF